MDDRRGDAISYLNGLRGIAASIVVLCHFAVTFYPSAVYYDPTRAHLGHGLETWIAATPLNILLSGQLAVCLFFVLSGYVLTVGFFPRPRRSKAVAKLLARYIRLDLPILASVLICWLTIVSGLCLNIAVIAVTKSEWLRLFFRIDANGFSQAFADGAWNVFASGAANYNPVLWTMRVELLGSYLVYLLVAVFGASRARFAAYAVVIAALADSYYVLFVIGALLASLETWRAPVARRRASQRVGWVLLTFGLLVGSHPYYFDAAITRWDVVDAFVLLPAHFYPRLSAVLIFVAVLLLPRLQTLLSSRPALFLGRVSFSLYLIHLVFICSFSSALFMWLCPYTGYNVAGLITLLLTVPGVLLGSVIMTRWVDEPAIRLAREAADRLYGLAERVRDGLRQWQSRLTAMPRRSVG